MPARVSAASLPQAEKPTSSVPPSTTQAGPGKQKPKDFDIFGEDEPPKTQPSKDTDIFSLNFGQQPPPVKPQPVAEQKKEPNLFEELFVNEAPKPQPVQPPTNTLGSINLYGSQPAGTNALGGINLYGNQPPAQMGLLGSPGFNITMQTGPQPVAQHPPQSQTTGFNLLGTTTTTTAPQLAKPDTSFLGLGSLVPSTSISSAQVFKGYENQHLQIVFSCSKESADTSLVVASFNNKTGSTIENLVFQVAFTKHLKIVSNNLTSTSVQPHSSDAVQQKMRLVNSSPQDRSLAMKLKFKLSYSLAGQKLSEEGMIANFPEGY